MRELEHLLREGSHRSLPEAPAAGSFESLQTRMQRPRPPRGPLYLLVGGLLLIGTWWAYANLPLVVPTELPTADVVRERVVPTPEESRFRPPVTSARPAAPVVQPLSPSKKSEEPDEPVTLLRQEVLPERKPESAAESASDTPTDASALPPAKEFAPAKTEVIGPLTSTRQGQAVASYLPRVHPFDSLTTSNSPSLLPKAALGTEDGGPSWDVSFSYSLTPRSTNLYTSQLTPEPYSPFATPWGNYVIDGIELPLYWEGTFMAPSKWSANPMAQLRINRQTRGKLRYGVGAAYMTDNTDQLDAMSKNTVDQPDHYFTAYRKEMRVVAIAGHVGLTFRRDRRLQPWVDVGIQAVVINRAKSEYYLVKSDQPQGWLQESNRLTAFGFLMLRTPTLQGGLQYLVSPRWSAGITIGTAPDIYPNISPTGGVEVRYRW